MSELVYSVRHIKTFDLCEGRFLDLWELRTRVKRTFLGTKPIVLKEFLTSTEANELCMYLNSGELPNSAAGWSASQLSDFLAQAERVLSVTS